MTTALVWPLLVQVALVFVIYIALGVVRSRAVKRGEMQYKEFTAVLVEPAYVARVSQHLRNQFELPVIFYVVSLLLIVTGQVTQSAVVLAWLFVLTRVLHSYFACCGTRIAPRRKAFSAGVLVLLVLVVQAACAFSRV